MSSEKKASVAKLVDATDSKSVSSNRVLVQVRPEVPDNALFLESFFILETCIISCYTKSGNKTIFKKDIFYEKLLLFV